MKSFILALLLIFAASSAYSMKMDMTMKKDHGPVPKYHSLKKAPVVPVKRVRDTNPDPHV